MAAKIGGPRASEVDDAFQPRGPNAAAPFGGRKIGPASNPWPTVLLITLINVGGFVALLVASHYVPALANPLRVAALVWFFGLGVIQTTFMSRHG